ncbi:MAG: response regulator [Burkholderiales bacterium]|nr:response regulator [Burkholderiales bacterium]
MPKITVLIVEDDQVDRIACRRAFAKDSGSAFTLLEAETGQEGLQIARAQKPDCILLDYHLPDLNGLEFLTQLADGAGEIQTPVILLTGADSAAVAAEAMRRGAREYLGKDSERQYLELLPTAIHRIMREQRLFNDKRRAEEALRHSHEELRRLAAHQERVKEQERKRIAQEIHDELGGLLTGIKAYISVVIDRATRAGAPPDPLLSDAVDLANNAIETVRKVITDLRPSVLDQLGVWAALEWYTGQIEKRSGISCECVIDPLATATELDPESSTMVFRIVQEALTNVVRHANASRVTVQVERNGGELLVVVQDNGKGIEPERLVNGHSWGILGMAERTRYFGGELKISGAPGQGTTVTLRLPLEEAHAG